MLLAGAKLAVAHSNPGTLPPVSEYDIRWFQFSDDHEIQDWDIEITPLGRRNEQFVVQAQPFPEEQSCWVATVPADGPARVRIRAVQSGTVSTWSAYTFVPEPSFGVALAAGSLLLAAHSTRQRKRTRPALEHES